jgi:hypothetical protein
MDVNDWLFEKQEPQHTRYAGTRTQMNTDAPFPKAAPF